MARLAASAACLALVIALAGCGGGSGTTEIVTVTVEGEAPPPVTVTETITAPAADAETEAVVPTDPVETTDEGGLGIGDQGVDAGASVTLVSIDQFDTVARTEGNAALKPQEGAQLVAAKIQFLNSGKRSVDIYCAGDLQAALVDTEGRRFDPVEDLDYIKGNTGCNELIQPGFQTTETIIFRIPAIATPAQLLFWDFNDGDDFDGEISTINFDVARG